MKKNGVYVMACVLVWGFIFLGCPTSGGGGDGTGGTGGTGGQQLKASDLYGSWWGTDRGYTYSVTITANGWTLSISNGFSDNGTYTVSGNSARMRSSKSNREIGTATAYDANSIIVTTYTVADYDAGTYILSRR